MTLNILRNAALNATADTSNPLTIEHRAEVRLTSRQRSDLYSEAIRAGFRTFRGVGVSARSAPMTLGAIPADPAAESLEFTGSGVVYHRAELTKAGWAARSDVDDGHDLESEAEARAHAWDRAA